MSADTEALVNTVNTVGVMGKGIALQFKNRFPNNYKVYREACKSKSFHIGELLVVHEGDLMNRKVIVNFPTKTHWKGKSKYEYISAGLDALRKEIINRSIESIAIPPLGCGNGGLEWARVKSLMEEILSDLDCDIRIFEPNEAIKNILRKEESTKKVKLTPARAMLLQLMFTYEGMGEQSSLFAANKLAYFLQRSGEKLRLNFTPSHYGPYSVQLNHVLLHLNGVYLKGLEQNTAEPFDELELNYEKLKEIENYVRHELSFDQQYRLRQVKRLIEGFESAYSIELLASVDFLMNSNDEKDIDSIQEGLRKWSNRKSELFKSEHVIMAYDHLENYASSI